jgi:hypothetical protein
MSPGPSLLLRPFSRGLSLVPWNRNNWKKNLHCDLKGHGNNWTPQEAVGGDRG